MHSQIQTRACTNKGSFYSIADTGFKIKKAGAGACTTSDHYTKKESKSPKSDSSLLLATFGPFAWPND